MTNRQRAAKDAAGDAPRRKRKREKRSGKRADDAAPPRRSPEERALRKQRRKQAGAAAEEATAGRSILPTLPNGGFTQPRVLLQFALTLAAAVAYERNMMGDDRRPYVLITLAVLSFLTGAAPGTNPRITVGAGAAIVSIGLALVGTRPSDLGVAACIFGGLLLTGGIHRLGRLGPEPASVQAGH